MAVLLLQLTHFVEERIAFRLGTALAGTGGTARRTGRRFRSDGSYGTLETMPSSAV
jgi:hypothetical protein